MLIVLGDDFEIFIVDVICMFLGVMSCLIGCWCLLEGVQYVYSFVFEEGEQKVKEEQRCMSNMFRYFYGM